MALNQFFDRYKKLFLNLKSKKSISNASSLNIFIYLLLPILFFLTFVVVSNLLNKKNEVETQNINEIVKSKEFLNLGDYIISKINSPYKEVKYLIQNNDNIEKILKKFEIKASDIKIISNNLKKKKTY